MCFPIFYPNTTCTDRQAGGQAAMTANWSKSNRSWRGRDRQRPGLAKRSGLLGAVLDGEHPRIGAVAVLLLASLHLYLSGLFQRHVPEPYMVRAVPVLIYLFPLLSAPSSGPSRDIHTYICVRFGNR